ncbi:DUF2818 family protein [Aquabacterium sp. J223]|uniref:DUF2818 family protein n=1 Tax=Aquabacterium sp. J223 TaxID=2898431 RepID=UPI0021ADB641|nr:DUF2818 family protein [Aquabacterium sp. J223]UUX94164.1 DUF2818 family protein [Aquabacterium sp. J223]
MDQGAAVWLVLLVGVLAANWPFFTERRLLVGPRHGDKPLAWRLVELLLMAALTLGLGWGLEARLGQRAPQGWAFYAAAGCLFLTFAFPGFVWRHLRRRRPEAD